jgi:hypothetical protein
MNGKAGYTHFSSELVFAVGLIIDLKMWYPTYISVTPKPIQ